MSDPKHAIGTRVVILGEPDDAGRDPQGVVVSHGHDATGIYTEVKLDDGESAKFHRSYLRAVTA